MGNLVVHFQLCAEDVDAMSAFYREVFGWRIEPRRLTSVDADVAGTYPVIDAEEGGIAGGITDRIPEKGGAVLVIEVDDIDATIERVVGHGGRMRFPESSPERYGPVRRRRRRCAVRVGGVRGPGREPGRPHPPLTSDLQASASRIASSEPGFSRLERSPGSSSTARARIARRTILALRVFGSSSTNTTFDGANGLPR